MARNYMRTVLSLVGAILVFSALAVAEKAQTIDVYTDAVLPDGQELKAGKYQVVVGEAEKEVQFLQGKKVVAKHPCRALERQERNRYNEVRYSETSDKKEKLTEIRLAGKSYILNLDVQQGM
jgi:cytochrome c-type biogenesis protein CcmE